MQLHPHPKENLAGYSTPRDFGAQTHNLTANGSIANAQRRNIRILPWQLLTDLQGRMCMCLPKAKVKMIVARVAAPIQGSRRDSAVPARLPSRCATGPKAQVALHGRPRGPTATAPTTPTRALVEAEINKAYDASLLVDIIAKSS